jgi:hypothetical protein
MIRGRRGFLRREKQDPACQAGEREIENQTDGIGRVRA